MCAREESSIGVTIGEVCLCCICGESEAYMSARWRVFQGILGTLNQKGDFLTLMKRLGNPSIFLVDSKEERGALQVLLKGLLLLARCSCCLLLLRAGAMPLNALHLALIIASNSSAGDLRCASCKAYFHFQDLLLL